MKRSFALILVILMILAIGCSSQKNSVAAQSATDGDVFDQIADGQQPAVTTLANDSSINNTTAASTASQNPENMRLYIITDSEPDAYDSLEAYVRDKCEFFYIEYSSVADWICRYDVGNENIADVASNAIKAGYTDIILDSLWYSYEEVDKLVSAYPDVQFYFDDGKGYYDEDFEDAYVEPNNDQSIEWTSVVFTYTDRQGYVFEITMKLSPWILLSNTSIINQAWQEVSNGKNLPSYNSWTIYENAYMTGQDYLGLTRNTLCSHGLNDMYYCVGCLSIENKTDGWPITEKNPISFSIPIRCSNDNKRDSADYFGLTAGLVYYSNKAVTYVKGIKIDPYITSNKWGPNPFVLMTSEIFSPNTPNGGYYEYVLHDIIIGGVEPYSFETEFVPETRVGVIGKDQKLVLP